MVIRVLVAALIFGLTSTPATAAVSVRVAPEARVAGEEISLGDLASVDGDAALARVMSTIRLGPAPVPGGTVRLDGELLRTRLRQAPVDLARVTLVVPDSVLVTRASQVVTGAELIRTATHRAQDRLEAQDPQGGPYALVPAGQPSDLRLPTGQVQLVAKIPEETRPPYTALTVMVLVRIDGRDHQTVPLTFRVGHYRNVVVAANALEPKTVLGVADFRVEPRVSFNIPPGTLSAISDPGSVEAVRSIKPGEILTESLLRPKIVVRRGEIVTLLVEGRGFRITAQGQAGEDARRDDNVRVINLTSKREVLGKVEGPGVVRVPYRDLGSVR